MRAAGTNTRRRHFFERVGGPLATVYRRESVGVVGGRPLARRHVARESSRERGRRGRTLRRVPVFAAFTISVRGSSSHRSARCAGAIARRRRARKARWRQSPDDRTHLLDRRWREGPRSPPAMPGGNLADGHALGVVGMPAPWLGVAGRPGRRPRRSTSRPIPAANQIASWNAGHDLGVNVAEAVGRAGEDLGGGGAGRSPAAFFAARGPGRRSEPASCC